MEQTDLVRAIEELKRTSKAVILAHNYQRPEVQDIADFVGDSLAMAQYAAASEANVILVAGVRFMAETVKILAPQKLVLVPDLNAGCPLADTITAEQVLKLKEVHPRAAVVSYVNTSAEVKAVSDICCTSSNAVRVVRSLPHQGIIFVPDRNLGAFVERRVPEKKVFIWDGFCPTHHLVSAEEVAQMKGLHPRAEVVVHPECVPEVQALADFIGSTSQIIGHIADSEKDEFIVGTEEGVMHALRKVAPNKQLYLASPKMVCPNMKKNTLEKVYAALLSRQPQIDLPGEIIDRARRALRAMLEVKP
ncbi:quinolinate synthase NadA [Coprothermobacteraceae bacterium]|nr:quinolinate synthase NadA [Coprothermobacteraceae bacterium]